jgi:hypothetical protein
MTDLSDLIRRIDLELATGGNRPHSAQILELVHDLGAI